MSSGLVGKMGARLSGSGGIEKVSKYVRISVAGMSGLTLSYFDVWVSFRSSVLGGVSVSWFVS